MDLSQPMVDVVTGVRGHLLLALVRTELPVTRRRLAGMARVSPGHANAVLDDLVDLGLVYETAAGRSLMVSLNRNHLAAEPVIALASLRNSLIERLRAQVSLWHGLQAAWLFGSVARGTSSRGSDIDMLVIFDDGHVNQADQAIAEVYGLVKDWTGNDLQVVEHTMGSWRELVRSNNPLVAAIRSDGIALTDLSARYLKRAA